MNAKLISLLEIAERARTGTKLPENDWNLSLYRTIQSLLTRYSLQYSGPDRFFDVDDDEVDRFFDAAITLLCELGVYCVTTNRVIPLTEDEIRTFDEHIQKCDSCKQYVQLISSLKKEMQLDIVDEIVADPQT